MWLGKFTILEVTVRSVSATGMPHIHELSARDMKPGAETWVREYGDPEKDAMALAASSAAAAQFCMIRLALARSP